MRVGKEHERVDYESWKRICVISAILTDSEAPVIVFAYISRRKDISGNNNRKWFRVYPQLDTGAVNGDRSNVTPADAAACMPDIIWHLRGIDDIDDLVILTT